MVRGLLSPVEGMSASLWCCITPEREQKTGRLMDALAVGSGGRVVIGPPPANRDPFVVWGQMWLTLKVIPLAREQGRPFFHIDNGFFRPAGGGRYGYYRITYRSLSPILLRDPPGLRDDLDIGMKPWRETGRHILLALPGRDFGRALGMNMDAWIQETVASIKSKTDRPVLTRPKGDPCPLAEQLRNCWALVTHSSNVAIDAVIAGVPVFVAPTSPAAPVGRTDLDFENPVMPHRREWWASLMAQQFTLPEMASGLAWKHMRAVAKQVD
jgi:hypothetical protein